VFNDTVRFNPGSPIAPSQAVRHRGKKARRDNKIR